MSTITTQTNIQLWHYTCPDCGIGDQDAGHLHPTHAIYCEVCLEDQRQVKLKRWPFDPELGALPSG